MIRLPDAIVLALRPVECLSFPKIPSGLDSRHEAESLRVMLVILHHAVGFAGRGGAGHHASRDHCGHGALRHGILGDK
jgi:hypothetical protein